MSKKVKFTIEKELNKKFKEIIKDKNDRSEIINNFIKNYVMDNKVNELNIDNILDKVAKYGTTSLTKEEREFLNKT